ncbi:MAG: hypothetical protein OXC00_09825 [Acidimicrobiaceae bacterium]|nr:hypothetical protein [Acidimicrobiaceae bacterium]
MGAVFAVRMVLRSARAVAVRPRLWLSALTQLARFAPDRWWRRPPFMPLPPPELARFRSETMYGDPAAAPSPADLVVWLEWCRAQDQRHGS